MTNRLMLAGLAAAALAAVANMVLSIVLRSIVDPQAVFMPLGAGSVAFLTIAGALAATVVYGYLQRRSTQPRKRFVQVAVVALLVSFLPDLGLLAGVGPAQNVTLERVLALMSMHVVAAVIIVGTLLKVAPGSDQN